MPPPNETRLFYNRISRAYDLIADSSEHIARDRGITLLAAAPGERVLVVGFGTGHAVVALGRAVAPGGRADGVDISEGMVSVASARIVKEHMDEGVGLSLGDARHLAYRSDIFDAVFIAFTLELFDREDIACVLQEIRRVLRPFGRLGVVAMVTAPHDTLMTEVYVWAHRHFPHWVDCRPIPVEDYLAQAGFVVTHTETLSLWGLPVAVVTATKRSDGSLAEGRHQR